MLVIVIVTNGSITNRRFNTDAGPLLVCRVDGNTRVVIEGIVLLGSDRMGDVNDAINGTGTNRVVVAGGPKREINISPVLAVVIANGK